MRHDLIRRSTALVLLAAFMCVTESATAQRSPGNVGIGLQVGDPSGVTLQFYDPGMSWDFLAAWDVDDFFFLNVHGLFARHLGQRQNLHFFYGPGGFVGFRDRPGDDDDVVVGISGTFGLGVLIERFEIYARVTPRLSVIPGTDGDVGAGLGVRYFF